MTSSAPVIDAVIPWVDGGDPAHRARLATYLGEIGGPAPKSAEATRFHDAGELEWCVASILRHAPFIRRIHILSDRQAPRLLQQIKGTRFESRIHLVDHRDSFRGYERHLPTFNSRAIISTLHRIPDLAEHYLFFNDDFALIRPLSPQDFFDHARVVLRGRWQRQSDHVLLRRLLRWLRRLAGHDPAFNPRARVRNIAAQERAARLAGFERRFLRVEHQPFPQRRSTLEAFFAAHPTLLEHNLSFRLRSAQQFKTEVLALHLEAQAGRSVFDARLRTVQLKPSEQSVMRVRRKLARADASSRYAFACVQSLELAPPALQATIVDWMNRRAGTLAQLLAQTGETKDGEF